MSTINHSSDNLNKMIDHVAYEIQMFRWAHLKLTQLRDEGVSSGKLHDAILESWVIHLRNLLNFFYATPRHDDVVASHFIVAWNPPSNNPLLEDAGNKANKQLAHLTMARVVKYNDEQKLWQCTQISNEINKCVSSFLEKLSPDQRAEFTKYAL